MAKKGYINILSTLTLLFGFQGMIPAFGEPLIVFESKRSDNYDIYVLDLATGKEKRLTTHTAYDAEPSWSPDGKQIVFTSYRDGNGEIYVMDADGSNPRNLTNHLGPHLNGLDREPCWSPDSSRIAFTSFRDGQPQIYVMDSDGANVQKLGNHPFTATQPSWSPDGSKIAFASGRNGISIEIYIMNADGTDVHNLTNHPSEDRYPAWSPDGQKIAFRSYRCCGEWPSIFVQNVNGGKAKRIPVLFNAPQNFSWTPDSQMILFNDNRQDSQLYMVNINTEKTQTIMEKRPMPGYNGHPRWFDSSSYAVTGKGKLPRIWGRLKLKALSM